MYTTQCILPNSCNLYNVENDYQVVLQIQFSYVTVTVHREGCIGDPGGHMLTTLANW